MFSDLMLDETNEPKTRKNTQKQKGTRGWMKRKEKNIKEKKKKKENKIKDDGGVK